MNRIEFMTRLEQLLWDISDSEREEALQYYNDYFEDAGWENEADVLRELGSPEQVANKIKAGFADEFSEYSEQGYQDTRFVDNQEVISGKDFQGQEDTNQRQGQWKQENTDYQQGQWESSNTDWQQKQYNNTPESQSKQHKNMNIWKIIAIILLCIIAVPILIPVGIMIAAVVFTVIVALIAVAFGLGMAGVAIVAVGIVVIVTGLTKLFLAPAVGILTTGIGCLLLSIGLLLTLAILLCAVKIVPALIRGIVGIIRYPFRKAGVI